MGFTSWADLEISTAEQACKNPLAIGCMERAYQALQILRADGHYGETMHEALSILNRLANGKPLSPIRDIPDEWRLCVDFPKTEPKTYQCTRMGSLFKDVYADGRIEYTDMNRVMCRDIRGGTALWRTRVAQACIDKMFPITMPYMPSIDPWVVYIEEGSYDSPNGDIDTWGLFYAHSPDGERHDISKYFKALGDRIVEIDETEYYARMHGNDQSQSTDIPTDAPPDQLCIDGFAQNTAGNVEA